MIDTVYWRLNHVRDQLGACERALNTHAPTLAELHALVDGAIQVTTTLADVVTALMRQAPATLEHRNSTVLGEVLADLRALHGCLSTGPLLLAPARDDLQHLLTTQQEISMLDDAPPQDLADQQRPADPEPVDDAPALLGGTDTGHAAPADLVDQHRDAPIPDDDERAS